MLYLYVVRLGKDELIAYWLSCSVASLGIDAVLSKLLLPPGDQLTRVRELAALPPRARRREVERRLRNLDEMFYAISTGLDGFGHKRGVQCSARQSHVPIECYGRMRAATAQTQSRERNRPEVFREFS